MAWSTTYWQQKSPPFHVYCSLTWWLAAPAAHCFGLTRCLGMQLLARIGRSKKPGPRGRADTCVPEDDDEEEGPPPQQAEQRTE